MKNLLIVLICFFASTTFANVKINPKGIYIIQSQAIKANLDYNGRMVKLQKANKKYLKQQMVKITPGRNGCYMISVNGAVLSAANKGNQLISIPANTRQIKRNIKMLWKIVRLPNGQVKIVNAATRKVLTSQKNGRLMLSSRFVRNMSEWSLNLIKKESEPDIYPIKDRVKFPSQSPSKPGPYTYPRKRTSPKYPSNNPKTKGRIYNRRNTSTAMPSSNTKPRVRSNASDLRKEKIEKEENK